MNVFQGKGADCAICSYDSTVYVVLRCLGGHTDWPDYGRFVPVIVHAQHVVRCRLQLWERVVIDVLDESLSSCSIVCCNTHVSHQNTAGTPL